MQLAVCLPIPMGDSRHSTETRAGENVPQDIEHPRGTLVIVVLFGLLFGLAWLSMYLFLFLERGAPRS